MSGTVGIPAVHRREEVNDPATTMLPVVPEPPGAGGSGWFAPPIPAEQHPVTVDSPTTQIAVVDRPSPAPRTPPAEPATVRPYVGQPVDVAYPIDDTPPPQVELRPLQVEIRAIHPDALADLAMALRPLLYEQLPTDGRIQHHHGEQRRDPAPDFQRPGDTTGLLCSTSGCSQPAGHAGPCDRDAAAHTGQED